MPHASQQLTGKVIKEPMARGSKSEHAAVMLVAGGRRYVLRRQGGNAFQDAALDALVGRNIVCTGRLAGYTFLIDDWRDAASAE